MAYSAAELICLDSSGPAAGDVGPSTKRFRLNTNDTAAVVQTDGYLDAAAAFFTPGVGDVLEAVMDCDGTPAAKLYFVTRTDGDIALTAFS